VLPQAIETAPPEQIQAIGGIMLIDAWALVRRGSAITAGPDEHHPVDIVRDVFTHYARAGGAYVDTSSFDRAKAASPGLSAVFRLGEVEKGAKVTGLGDDISMLAASMDLDVFTRWDGRLAVALTSGRLDSTGVLAAAASSVVSFDETTATEFADWYPTRELRSAYFNRLVPEAFDRQDIWQSFYRWHDSMPYPSTSFYDPPPGVAVAVAPSVRPIERRVSMKFVPMNRMAQNPWEYRALDTRFRRRVRLTTDMRALGLELGDFFRVTWTRGLVASPAYSGTLFQCDSIEVNPNNNTCTISGVWMADIETSRPYLLDDENLGIVAKSTGARNVTLTNGSGVVTFAAGSVITEGVVAGDILMLNDTTEAADTWTRNRALRITSVNSATSITVVDENSDPYPWTTGVYSSAIWSIRRGATYAAIDAVNYPNGRTFYGKVSNASSGGTYSDGLPGHIFTE
jgi:hypothetical protein